MAHEGGRSTWIEQPKEKRTIRTPEGEPLSLPPKKKGKMGKEGEVEKCNREDRRACAHGQTTTDDDGNELVRCRLVARDFTPRREGPRDDLFAAMPRLEATEALFALVASVGDRRREQGLAVVKVIIADVKKAHLNARCDEEEWVELPDEFEEHEKYATLNASGTMSRYDEFSEADIRRYVTQS